MKDILSTPGARARLNLINFETGESYFRLPRNKVYPFASLPNLIQEDPRLSDDARSYIWLILQQADQWCLDHLTKWLAGKRAHSLSKSKTIVLELVIAGYLTRTLEYSKDKRQRIFSYKVHEAPIIEPREKRLERVTILRRTRLCDGTFRRGPGETDGKRFGAIQTDFDPKSLPKRRAARRGGPVAKIPATYKRGMDVLHSSEHPSTPISPKGDRDFSNGNRVKGSEEHPARQDATARCAKHRKGRKSPFKDHSSGRRSGRLSRSQINLSGFRSVADSRLFMATLSTSLQPALAGLSALPPARTKEWLEALKHNPLVAVAQEAMDLSEWDAASLRRFLRMLGKDLPIADLLLVWIANDLGCWLGSVPFDIRRRLRERKRPTSPDICKNEVWPEMRQLYHRWDEALDECRRALICRARRPVTSLIEGVDFNDPQSIRQHRLAWTAILNSPLSSEYVIATEVLELARETVIPISHEDVAAWVKDASEGMPCGWWGGLCGDITDCDYALEAIVGRGISAILSETLPEGMWMLSKVSEREYVTDEMGWNVTARAPIEPVHSPSENKIIKSYKAVLATLDAVRANLQANQDTEVAEQKLKEIRHHFAAFFVGQEPLSNDRNAFVGGSPSTKLEDAMRDWHEIEKRKREALDAEWLLYREYCDQMAEDDEARCIKDSH